MRKQMKSNRPTPAPVKAPPPEKKKLVVRDLPVWPAQKHIIRRMGLAPKNMIIVDGGARKGNVTAKYLELFPGARVHAFEPEESGYQIVRDRFSDKVSVEVVNKALGSELTEATFYVGGHRGEMSSLLPRAPGKRYYRHELEPAPYKVEVTTLDEYFYRNPGPHIIKLDLQGGELAALNGAKNLLARTRNPMLIYTEVLFVEMYRDNPTLLHLWDFLMFYGYELFDLYNFARSKVNRRLKVADALFVSGAVVDMLEAMPEEWLPKSLPQRLEK